MSDWPAMLDAIARSGGPRVLVTLARLDGSAPRDPGAKMLVGADGVHGTIGGGRLEHETTRLARTLLGGPARTVVREIALGPRLGQCCGGSVVVLLEPLHDLGWCAAVRARRDARRACVVATLLDGPDAGAKRVVDDAGSVLGISWVPPLEATTLVAGARTVLLEPVPIESPILVFGAGHVGRALVTILGTLPRPVRWIDGRTDVFPAVRPTNVAVETSDAPETEVDDAPPGASYVVVTHSHALDLAIVERVLRRGDFAYLGLIGSRTKRRRFERRLALRGIAPDALARLRCPIGIGGVGGKHPGEIAVAVAAELLAVGRAALNARRDRSSTA